MNFLFVYSDDQHEWNSSEWRCVIPAEAIDRHTAHKARLLSIADFANRSPKAEELCSEADIVIVERSLYGQILTAIMHWKAQGKGIIANFDDAYHLLPEENFSHDFWLKGISQKKENGEIIERIIDPPPITQFKWGLRMVHGAIVASKKLVEDWKNYTDVRHLPMYLDFSRYRNITPQDNQGIIIGWSGSMSHLHSFSEGILDALESVCRARPQVKLKIGNDRRIYDRLQVAENQKMLTPWVPYEEWPSVLGSYDIGLAPMEGEFDARRSWVKVLEYMAMKIPWVASRSPAYQGLGQYGQLIENSSRTWADTLLKMVDEIEHYKKHAAEVAYEFALRQSSQENAEHIVNVLTDIVSKDKSYQQAKPVIGSTSKPDESLSKQWLKNTAKYLEKGELNKARLEVDKILESKPGHEKAFSLFQEINKQRREQDLPYLFPAGLGSAQTVDGISGLLTQGDLQALAFSAKQSEGICVNVGVFNGLSTYFIAKTNPDLEVYGIDAYQGMSAQKKYQDLDQMKIAQQNLAHRDNAHLIVGRSADIAADWNRKISFLFIDGNHSVEGAFQDFKFWAPFLTSGGLIAIHDAYRKVNPGITKVRKKSDLHGPDMLCNQLEENEQYEFVMVKGCTEVWRKKNKQSKTLNTGQHKKTNKMENNFRGTLLQIGLESTALLSPSNRFHILEIGCMYREQEGLSTYHLAKFQSKRSGDRKFISIDSNPEHIQAAKKMIADRDKNINQYVHFLLGHSLEKLPEALNHLGPIDFAFLDGGAHPEVCLQEFEQTANSLADHGLIILDDLQNFKPSELYPLSRPYGKGTLILPALIISKYLTEINQVDGGTPSSNIDQKYENKSKLLTGLKNTEHVNLLGSKDFKVISIRNHSLLIWGNHSQIDLFVTQLGNQFPDLEKITAHEIFLKK